MMHEYERIQQSARIGPLTIKNRISMSPMEKQWADRVGNVTDFYIDYMVERARNEVGMITMESTFVDPVGRGNIFQLGLWSDSNIDSHRRLNDAVHRHGTVTVTELMHSGRQAATFKTGFQPEAPSPTACALSGGYLPRELNHGDIRRITDNFARAARRAVLAGYDMITLHGAHGYLLSSFLSPLFNQRSDEYGSGSKNGHWLFGQSIYDAVRAEVGSAVPIGYRISAGEAVPGGLELPDAIAFIRHLATRGLNYVDVSAGVYESAATIVQPMDVCEGCLLPAARAMKAAVQIPVIAAGRINSLALAERALADEDTDFVHMGRAFHADPEIYVKSLRGAEAEVVTCIACNKCISTMFAGKRVVCTVNPGAGQEREFRIKPAAVNRSVLVVGGGLAGMEAATTAAKRGHTVTLIEKEPELGGSVRAMAASPHRGNWRVAIKDRIHALRRTQAEIVIGKMVRASDVNALSPDVLVIATGTRPFIPPYLPGFDLPHVTNYEEVLLGQRRIAGHVAVIGGQAIGANVAEYLLEQGCRVTIVEDSDSIAGDVEGITQGLIRSRLESAPGLRVLLKTNVERIENDVLVVQSCGKVTQLRGIAYVVFALHRDMNRDLVEEMAANGNGMEVHVIGDAAWPREPYDAILDGARLGRAI
jgi:2,4-dienoyl-CoA reductase-like NADH-dependent reductase (Old Yellow Enzyme family)/thioredoxin reductase